METSGTTGQIEERNTIETSINLYHDPFVVETLKIGQYLRAVKILCDKYELKRPSLQNQIKYIDSIKDEIFTTLDIHFYIIWETYSRLSEEQRLRHKIYYQKALMPYLATRPLNRRICEKPLGYNGDYQTISYYYRDGYEGETLYDKLMHRYTLSIPLSRSVINRSKYFREQIGIAMDKYAGQVNITSVGSGPANEIIEYSKDSDQAERCHFSCVDFEVMASEYVKQEINRVERLTHKKINISYYTQGVLKYLMRLRRGSDLQKQHLIYSAGLFDYLDNEIAAQLLLGMYISLNKGGKIIITNFCKKIEMRAYLEVFGDWALILRDKEDMLSLAERIIDEKKSIQYDETGQQLLLIIER